MRPEKTKKLLQLAQHLDYPIRAEAQGEDWEGRVSSIGLDTFEIPNSANQAKTLFFDEVTWVGLALDG